MAETEQHLFYMQRALSLANEAAKEREVPVGCVVVYHGDIVGYGRNRCEAKHLSTAHAEMEAIAEASHFLGDWRLEHCTLYVTLEPCPMCAGAILNARISHVFYGVRDRAMGGCGGVLNLFMEDFSAPKPTLVGGILEEECKNVLHRFFTSLRNTERN